MIHTDVYIPAVDCTYEFMLDEKAVVEDVVKEIVDILQRNLGGAAKLEANAFALYDYEGGRRLFLADSLECQNILNGSKLLLV